MGKNKADRKLTSKYDQDKSGRFAKTVVGKIFTYILNTIMTILLIAVITGTIVGIAFAVYVANYINVDVSEVVMLSTNQDMTTRLYYMDYATPDDRVNRIGTPIEVENQQLFSSQNRTWTSYSEMPTYLVEAFVSIEDERFWDHDGVDWKRTLGATFNFALGKTSYGGSTITQQLIKNVTGDNDVSIQRKVKEIMTALELEKTLDKTQIIEMYLNTIYLSEHCYGVNAAAKAYFGKEVSELSLTECAALASIPKYPYKYDPYVHPENNKKRRDTVLMKMYELGKITQAEYQQALDTELVLSENVEAASQSATTSWYTDAVIDEAVDLLSENLGVTDKVANQMVYTGGLHIYTVMDPFVQRTLEEYFANDDNFTRINNGVQPEASMVVSDPYSGDILGLVGGRGEKTSSRILNYATQTTRSPGSSIKPVGVYGPAIDAGIISYSSLINDAPVENNWPVNYPAGYRGPTPIYDAVARSVNTVAVRVLQKYGVENSYHFMHDQLEMTSIIDSYETKSGDILSDINLSALGLGGMTYGVTVRELTSAYQIFPNGGAFNGSRTIIKILDSNGNVIIDNSAETTFPIREDTSRTMIKIMKGVVSYGTASRLTLSSKVDCAGKTGTTSDDCDRWYIGYTPYYLGGVWFGYAMPMSLNGFSETQSPALTIWDDIMTALHQPIFDYTKDLKTFPEADREQYVVGDSDYEDYEDEEESENSSENNSSDTTASSETPETAETTVSNETKETTEAKDTEKTTETTQAPETQSPETTAAPETKAADAAA